MSTHEEASKTLTRTQKRFCKEYIIDFNGTEAYMRASGTTNRKSAGVQASKLLKMDKVNDFIQAYAQEQLGPLEKDLLGNVRFWIEIRDKKNEHIGPVISIREVLELLEEYAVDEELIKEVQKLRRHTLPEARPADRLKASEMLAKYRSMFVEKKEVNVTAAVTIVDDIKGKS